ncbi:MAG: hypothetical protein AAFW84_09850 [Cyanobacteria bacterium J06635_15]
MIVIFPLRLTSLAAFLSFLLGGTTDFSAIALERMEIDTQAAQERVPVITVPGGHSVVLSFDNGQYIHSIWLDDQSILGIATDRPLCGDENANDSECGFARTIRLQRLSGQLDLSGPSFSTNVGEATLLTVITTDNRGDNPQTYQFLADTTAQAPSNVSYVSIVPASAQAPDSLSILQERLQERSGANYDIEAIKTGREVAIAQGLANQASQAWLALENFIDLVENNGYQINVAISESAVSIELLDELQRLSSTQQI